MNKQRRRIYETFIRKIRIIALKTVKWGVILGTKGQMSQNVEIASKEEGSTKKLLNILGIFIFGGLALSNVTNPLPSSKSTIEFLLFIGVSAVVYYFLVIIYFIGQIGRKIFFTILILLSCFSIYMVFYLTINSIPH
ncbi:hypothetical protein MPH47_18110 [Psychrobacillus psychrodurans]|uniref:hypothetical protein n=1 Tax=Psychrobacillus psychrodurans TaxID=126157 RepID=UPI001F4E3577|nr:hypothetical protein [Psychrobacillus psychrodurans]MCK1999112.1 hypothetical protein [Psychrobacillus psychrodurans]